MPSGAPCASAVSCLCGLPHAMCVRTMMSDGRSVTRFACAIAVSIALRSLPSAIRCTCQPYDSKRLVVLSDKASSVDPSIVLRVSRCAAPPLAELLDLVEREIVAREIKDAVEQHAGMARRQDKAIAVQPFGIRGIVSQMALPQHVRERRQRHCRAGMPRIGLLYGVHRERTDGVDAELIELHASDGGGLGHSNPDLAACHNLVRRSKPSTSSSTCRGDGDACAAIFSSSTSLGISWRPCFKLSMPI